MVLICLIVASPPVALSEEIDEGEFSQATLGYKLQLLRDQFEQTVMGLLTRGVAGSVAKRLEHVYNEIKCLEAEFRRGKYYPDLLDEPKRVVTTRLESALVPRAAISGSSDATVTGCALLESHDFSRGSGSKPWAIASPNHRSGLESARDSAQAPA